MKRTFCRTLLLLPTVVCWLTGCSDVETDLTAPKTPVVFAAQVEHHATRAAVTDYRSLAASSEGFGVFASGAVTLDNEQVTFRGTLPDDVADYQDFHLYNWRSYSKENVRWPDSTSKASFYAYAPYNGTNNGKVSAILYTVATKPSEGIDLLWGINDATNKPWENVTSKTAPVVFFTFHHALSAIGFHVQAMIDEENSLDNLKDESDVDKNSLDNLKDESDVDNLLGSKYTIHIKSVKLEGSFYEKGELNLQGKLADASSKYKGKYIAKWDNQSGNISSLTVNTGDMPDNISSGSSGDGITQKARQRLIKDTDDNREQAFMVIPHKEANYDVTLTWTLTGKIEGVEQPKTYSKKFTLNNWELEAGVKYYLNFVIGLTTLKLDVTAEDWDDEEERVPLLIEQGTSASQSLSRKDGDSHF